MEVLNPKFYTAWSLINEPAAKYWIRLWQNGLHTGTHPEWTFSPLSLTTLAQIWLLFLPRSGERDWGQPQRHAIQQLARNRAWFPEGQHLMIPSDNNDVQWTQYFEQVTPHSDGITTSLIESLLTDMRSSAQTSIRSMRLLRISSLTAAVAAEFLRSGYSEYELYIRSGTGIIDPNQQRSEPHMERIRGFLAHCSRRPTSGFLISTRVLSTPNLSRGAAKKLAPLELLSEEAWKGRDGFVRIGDCVFALTKCEATHSITAFLEHRRSASHRLQQASARHRLVGLRLDDKSTVTRTSVTRESNARRAWTHTLPKTTVFEHLPPCEPTKEPESFAAALSAVEEDPETAIRLLSEAYERQLGKIWPTSFVKAYQQKLRNRLSRRVAIALDETADRWRKKTGGPSWLPEARADGYRNFGEIASRIRADGAHHDEFLAQKLDSIANPATRYWTHGALPQLLNLAKGVRNVEVHSGEWPANLVSVSRFLARLMLTGFSDCFPANEKIADRGAEVRAHQ